MWILQFIPTWIFYCVILLGIAGLASTYLLKFIPLPAIYMYKTPIQIGAIVTITLGTFLAGAGYDNDAWLARVKELEDKVAIAEQQSKEANAKLDEKVESTTEKIVEKQVVLKQYVDREIVKYDSNCVIPKDFIDVINKSTDDVRKRSD